ncbi:MAG: metallophosphoesterase [Promethearchaeota archaeon]
MRILFFSDLHQDHNAITHIEERLKQVDCAFGLGDFATFGKGLGYALEQLDVGTDIYLLPGNHDDAEELKHICAESAQFHFFHGKQITLREINFAGLGGGMPGLPFAVTEEKARLILGRFYHLQNLILCTHTPPYGTTVDRTWGGNHIGYRSLRDFVSEVQPLAVYSGHVHEAEGKTDVLKNTKLMVVGKQGHVINID